MKLNKSKLSLMLSTLLITTSTFALDIKGFSKDGFNEEGFHYSDFKNNENKCKEILANENKRIKEEHESKYGKINLNQCYILNSDKKCEDVEEKPADFIYHSNLMGFNGSSLRCQLIKDHNDNVQISKDLILIDIYG